MTLRTELRYVVTLPPADLMDRMDAVVSTVLPSLLDEQYVS